MSENRWLFWNHEVVLESSLCQRTGGWSRLISRQELQVGGIQIRVSVPPTPKLPPTTSQPQPIPYFGQGHPEEIPHSWKTHICNEKWTQYWVAKPRTWKRFVRLGAKGCTTVAAVVGMRGVGEVHNPVFGSWRRRRGNSCMSSIMRWAFCNKVKCSFPTGNYSCDILIWPSDESVAG